MKRCIRRLVLIWLGAGLCGVGLAQSPEESAETSAQQDPQAAQVEAMAQNRCGTNALYVLLQLHGKPVELPQIHAVCSFRPDGVTLAEIQRVAGEFGLPCEVRKLAFEELPQLPTPALVHIETATIRGGHYVVVLEVGRDTVRVIDGVLGREQIYSFAKFQQRFTGFALFAVGKEPNQLAPTTSRRDWTLVISFVALVFVGVYLGRTRGFRGGKRRQPAGLPAGVADAGQ